MMQRVMEVSNRLLYYTSNPANLNRQLRVGNQVRLISSTDGNPVGRVTKLSQTDGATISGKDGHEYQFPSRQHNQPILTAIEVLA